MALKLVILSAVYLLFSQINTTGAATGAHNYYTCNLDSMKRFALNSCEILIKELFDNYAPDPHNERLKREILEYGSSTNNSPYDESRHDRPTHLRIIDPFFPHGGYIVLDHLHAKILRKRYRHMYHPLSKQQYELYENNGRPPHSDGNSMSNEVTYRRRKRHNEDRKKNIINITYCCLNRCSPYDLCQF